MADVFIVAIFLSYIGISSFLDNVLKISVSRTSNISVIPNTNNSNLEMGVIFFSLFVIFSLLYKSGSTGNLKPKYDNYF